MIEVTFDNSMPGLPSEGEIRIMGTSNAETAATLRLAREQLTTNRLLVALIDQLGAMAQTMPGPGYPVDPSIRIREYLPAADWERIEATPDMPPGRDEK